MFGLDPSAEEREVSALPRLGRTARLMLGAGVAAVGGVALLHYTIGWGGVPRTQAEPDQHVAVGPALAATFTEPKPVEQQTATPRPPPDQPQQPAAAVAHAAPRPAVGGAHAALKSMDVQVDYKPARGPDEMDGRTLVKAPGCTLLVGQRIPVALDQVVISEVQAPIGGVVREDVFAVDDPTAVLIPQGSLVSGSYRNTDLGPERRRLDASFDYVTRPDGTVVRLGGAAAVDAAGAGGIPGKVVTHWPTWFFNTVALWMIGAAEQQGSVSSGGTAGAAGSVETSGAQVVGQNGRAAVASSLNFRPTIVIKAGTLINLVMTRMDRAC
jgi:type IV secretory pathway VirB10-like protein